MKTPVAMDTRPSSEGRCASARGELDHRRRWVLQTDRSKSGTVDLLESRRGPNIYACQAGSGGRAVRQDGEVGRPPEGHGSGVPDSETKTRAVETIRTWCIHFLRSRCVLSCRHHPSTMCGILAVLGCVDNSQATRSRIIKLSRRLRHRGPDWSGLHCYEDCYLAHERLAIIDPISGDQPLYSEDKTVVVTVNGEIYNHKALRESESLKSHKYHTGSDCEVLAHLVVALFF
ncbi:hypothetical protein Bca52824_005544 [Brassica carinata]|uniref:Glutamine amidotransferase type-2 domain-containing protein n=1 Tax=Brassica carinata TaxID=52824 RepID=A0A8X7WNR2_BRACI|nr:hypothetical protein Bca52824_005544 [Brassica carinata]